MIVPRSPLAPLRPVAESVNRSLSNPIAGRLGSGKAIVRERGPTL